MEFHDYAIEALINSDICRGYKDYLLGELRKAEKIVTCKECKHYKIHGEDGYCSKRVNTESHIDVYREPNYFCALGERRE